MVEMTPTVLKDLAKMRGNEEFQEVLELKLKEAVLKYHFDWEGDFLAWSIKVSFFGFPRFAFSRP